MTGPIEQGSELRLCLAAPRFHPVYSGPGMRFRRYEPGLRHRGVRMHVVAETPVDRADTEAPETGVEHVDGIPVHRAGVPPDGQVLGPMAYARALLRHCRAARPDVVQLLGLPLPAVPWIARLRKTGIPLVFTHTMDAELASNPWRRRLQRFLRRLPFRSVDRIVVSSGVMLERLEELGVTRPIEVIPNGVDLERFRPPSGPEEKAAIRKRLGFRSDEKLLLFVGTLNERKGVDLLLEAWARIAGRWPDTRLVLVGPRHSELGFAPTGEVAFEAKLDAIIEREGLADRVVFTGAVQEVGEYLRAGDLFVFPSRREGMPNVVPEAFACGLPSILTPFSGLPDEFGRPGEHYVLVERTVEGLAAAMGSLLDDAVLRDRLAGEALGWVRQHLDVERSLDLYAAMYRELVASSRIEARQGNP